MKISFTESQKNRLKFSQKVTLYVTHFFTLIFPRLSAYISLKFFCNPKSRRVYDFRTQIQPEVFDWDVEGNNLKAYSFQKEKKYKKTILLTHGWADTSVRFTSLIDFLVNEGFKVWVFDHIGHGKSSLKTSHLILFIKGLSAVMNQINKIDLKEVDALLAHSMGSLAVLNLEQKTLENKKVIIASAPTLFFENMFERITSYGVSALMLKNFLDRISKKSGFDWDALAPLKQKNKIGENFLFIHDKNDPVCSFDNIKMLVENTPHHFFETKGLGHLKIIKDHSVHEKISSFLTSV